MLFYIAPPSPLWTSSGRPGQAFESDPYPIEVEIVRPRKPGGTGVRGSRLWLGYIIGHITTPQYHAENYAAFTAVFSLNFTTTIGPNL
jgi:hypothetical protein